MVESMALLEAAAEKLDRSPRQLSVDELSVRLSLENQVADAGRSRASVTLVALELSGAAKEKADSSIEPYRDTTFVVRTPKSVVIHQGGPIGPLKQELAVGGQISKNGDIFEINFPNDEKVAYDAKTGTVQVDSKDSRYQYEVHFKGTPWQRTIITSDHETRVEFGPKGIGSIERNGAMEIFPGAFSLRDGSEPPVPESQRLAKALKDHGRQDLVKLLNKVDHMEALAEKTFNDHPGEKNSIRILSDGIRERGLLFEKAAGALPGQAKDLKVAAENQLRIALRNMREQFGAGTPETKDCAHALQSFLKANPDSDQEEEVERLGFELKRAGQIKDVIDNIAKSPNKSAMTMPAEQAQTIRRALISTHIAGGDEGLKAFVNDVNQRLDKQQLVAPNETPGPFHHGGIIWTPEGSTRYGGSFELVPRK